MVVGGLLWSGIVAGGLWSGVGGVRLSSVAVVDRAALRSLVVGGMLGVIVVGLA